MKATLHSVFYKFKSSFGVLFNAQKCCEIGEYEHKHKNVGIKSEG